MRPTNYDSDCKGRPRPCPWVGCRHHLLIDVTEVGSIAVNVGRIATSVRTRRPDGTLRRRRPRNLSRRVPVVRVKGYSDGSEAVLAALDQAAETDAPTCVLDLVEDRATYTLEEIGDILSVSRERVRQIETMALEQAGAAAAQLDLEDWEVTAVRRSNDEAAP